MKGSTRSSTQAFFQNLFLKSKGGAHQKRNHRKNAPHGLHPCPAQEIDTHTVIYRPDNRKDSPFTIIPDRNADAGAGATGCAVGSHA